MRFEKSALELRWPSNRIYCKTSSCTEASETRTSARPLAASSPSTDRFVFLNVAESEFQSGSAVIIHCPSFFLNWSKSPQVNPELLKKKDRARPTAEQQETIHLKKYGQTVAADFVSGTEVLNEDSGHDEDDSDDDDAQDSDDGEWVSGTTFIDCL